MHLELFPHSLYPTPPHTHPFPLSMRTTAVDYLTDIMNTDNINHLKFNCFCDELRTDFVVNILRGITLPQFSATNSAERNKLFPKPHLT